MRKLYVTCYCLLLVCCAYSQGFSLNDLISYTGYTPSRFENSISKRGYRIDGYNAPAEGRAYSWHAKKAKDATIEKSIFKCDKEDKALISYKTTSADEFNNLRQQLGKEGYHFADGAKTELYQKGNITVQPQKQGDSTKMVYSVSIERKALPKAKDIVYAEDFLQLTSHEFLVSVFGAANVKSDKFYFSEKEINRCSVLFPNTSMQVIFIWKDEENLRNPAFILIGGQLQAQSSLSYHKQIEQNVWQSRQGIYSGMSLGELQRLNGQTLRIWGWQSDQPGVAAEQQNKGIIDFKELNLVLNCLDCNEDGYYSKNELLSSDNILREGRRVYVSTIILLPKKEVKDVVGMRR